MARGEINLSSTETVETRADFGDSPEDRVSFWLSQDKAAEKLERKWIRRSRKIVKRYRDERPDSGALSNAHQFNILWSNVQTLKPAIYARSPKADVERRYRDQDPIGRLASTLLERCISWSLDACEFDQSMAASVLDYLLPGRGVMRVVYCPYYGEPIEDDKDPDGAEETEKWGKASIVANDGDENIPLGPDNKKAEKRPVRPANEPGTVPEGQEPQEDGKTDEPLRYVVDEEAKLKYVFWEDYREGPARTWSEVPWVRFRAYMNRSELVDRFGGRGKTVKLDAPLGEEMNRTSYSRSSQERGDLLPDVLKQAEIWEVWDKARKRVIWFAPGSADLGFLDQVDDPLNLPDFFPNPDPLLATTTTDNRVPVPDYIEYQDQADEMDLLTARIDRLLRALKVSGVYAGAEKASLQQLIDEGTENKLIPVEDWAAFTDKGGLSGMIHWMPIQQVAETVIQLYAARDRTKQVLYEITGMSDIMRGATSPVETATAQQIKAQFGTLRLNDRQRAVARYARDCIRLVGYVISGEFSPETISRLTGYPKLQPVPPAPPPVIMDPASQQPVPNPAMQQYMQAAQPIMQQNQQAQAEFDAACKMLKDDMPNGFKIDIEADSTILPDEQQEKQARVEFLGALTPFLQQGIPLAMGNPAVAGFIKDATLFLTRGFRTGREMEGSIEKMFDALSSMPPPQPPGAAQKAPAGPDPAEGQAKMITAQSDAVSTQKNDAIKAQTEQAKIAQANQKQQQDFELGQERNHIQAEKNAADLALDTRKQESDEAFKAVQISHRQMQDAQGLT